MSHTDDEQWEDWDHAPRKRRGGLIALLVLAVVLVVVATGGVYAYHRLASHFSASPDYPGPGSGKVTFEVKQGETVTDMGRALRAMGVVESVDGFISAASADSKANSIQVGFYSLKHKMASSDVLAVLTDPKKLIQSAVTIPEGYRVTQIEDAIVKGTKLSRADVKKAVAHASSLGLPAAAHGNVEGWLFPATYSVPPNLTADDLVREMIAKTVSVLSDLNVSQKAQALGLSEENVLTVASILEYEARLDVDYPKVAEAIYNRLKIHMPIQSDATVSYATHTFGSVTTTDRQRASSSPYNTYTHQGLPPGPIGSPGEKTIQAALNPTKGPWLYWVVVNLKTGKTLYATTYAQHLQNVAKFQQYCQSNAC